MTLSSQLADHYSALQFAQIPPEKKKEIKRLLLDYLGVALAGSATDSGRIAADFAIELGGAPQATLIGRGNRVPGVHAALANAVASHSIELDDVDDEALFHYSPPVYSAGLAAAEMAGASGEEFLTAVYAGCEMMNRLSRATNPCLRDRGFHTTPTCGVFGGTVAVGKLLKLSAQQLTDALGLAGAQSSGLMEMYGISMQKRINPGPAARNAVTAASLAKLGFTGADTIIEGKRGFGAAFSSHLDPSKLTEGLGREFPVTIEYKPYSCARPIHNAIDCALKVRKENSLKLDRIAEITYYRHPAWADFHVINRPRTYHEAQVSLPYSAAVALVEGAALLPQYSEEKLKDNRIMSLAEKVKVLKDPSLPRGVSCRLIVKMADGKSFTSQVDYPKGSVQNPMSDAELAGKFSVLASGRLNPQQINQVVQMTGEIEKQSSLSALMKLVS
jgi:2-methylcitrate dehydratase PrpD